MTVTTRLTRNRAISGCHVTSAKWAPNECVEYFALGSPKVDADLPSPETCRRLARRSTSENGTPLAAPSDFRKTRPFSNPSSSGLWPSNGEPGVDTATIINDPIALSAAARTAGTIDGVAIEPPESGPSGSVVSPSATSTFSIGTPVRYEAICARFVYVPVPMSWVAEATRAVPSSRSCRLAAASNRAAIHEQLAIPHPSVKPSRFIEPTAWVRFDHPNLSEPRSKHSTRWRDENGSFEPSSILGSFIMRSLTGSILS